MEAALSTSAAVLQALMEGPRYGRELIRTIAARAHGTVNPRPGTVYRALVSLARKGHIRSWTVVPGGRRGARARRYYELTTKGIAVTEKQREALGRLLGLRSPERFTEEDVDLMSERIRRTAELSAFALRLKEGMLAAGRRS
jgi:DNA-binding PadR family transcriptional regulator